MPTNKSNVQNSDDRDVSGKFSHGNAARGRRKSRTDDEFAEDVRNALKSALSKKAIAKIARQLVSNAESGDRLSIKEIFDRITGRPGQSEMLKRIESLERAAKQPGEVKE